MYKMFLTFFALSISVPCWAKSAKCTIEIWDYTSDTKYIVEQSFEYPANPPGEHKRFKLPGSTYTCALGFYNLEIGTDLICYFGKFGEYQNGFVKSDRTGIKENLAKNNLIFRTSTANFGLKSSCK